MKKSILLVLLSAVAVSLALYVSIKTYKDKPRIKIQKSKVEAPHKQDIESASIVKTSLFVPYWQLNDSTGMVQVQGYNRYVYFGVTANTNGIVKDDPGYKHLETFQTFAPSNIQTILAIRMTDSDINDAILADSESQKKIAQEAAQVAVDNGFSGILVDFEYQALFGDTVTPKISSFISILSQKAHAQKLQFSTTIYGDVFYRKRPYDVGQIAKISDEVMIMAYDFHKSRGEAGPNFPLQGAEKYGYDYEQMIHDFSQITSIKKLTVIFGMYGYDWIVDEKKRPIKSGSSMTLAEITQNYIDQCQILNCVQFRDKDSAESEIDFVDQYNQYHIVWYEDKQSVESKKEYLNQKGIKSTAFWAYGYF